MPKQTTSTMSKKLAQSPPLYGTKYKKPWSDWLVIPFLVFVSLSWAGMILFSALALTGVIK
jgi:hypothetical protein